MAEPVEDMHSNNTIRDSSVSGSIDSQSSTWIKKLDELASPADIDLLLADGDIVSLHCCVRACESALGCPKEYDAGTYLLYLGYTLGQRFALHSGSLADADRAVGTLEDCLQLCLPGNTLRPLVLLYLADALRRCMLRRGDWTKMEHALELAHDAVSHSELPYVRYRALVALSALQMARFEQFKNSDDLEAAGNTARQGLSLAPPTGYRRVFVLLALGDIMDARWDQTENPSFLESGIEYRKECLEHCAMRHPIHLGFARTISISMLVAYDYTSKASYLDGAIDYSIKFMDLLPINDSNRGIQYYTLRRAFESRYHLVGDPKDLEMAIQYHTDDFLWKSRQLSSSDTVSTLDLSAEYYIVLASFTEARNNVEKGIQSLEKLVELTLPDDVLLPDRMLRCADALLLKSEITGTEGDLDRAIRMYEDCLACANASKQSLSRAQRSLGGLFVNRYLVTNDLDDLEASISHFSQATDIARDLKDNTGVALALYQLASSYLMRLELQSTDRIQALESVIAMQKEALTLLPLGVPIMSSAVYIELGDTLRRRFTLTSDLAHREESIHSFRQALELNYRDSNGDYTNAVCYCGIGLNYHMTDVAKDSAAIQLGIKAFQSALGYCPKCHPKRAAIVYMLGLQTIRDLRWRSAPIEDPKWLDVIELLEEATSQENAQINKRLDAAVQWANLAQWVRHTSALRAFRTALGILHLNMALKRKVTSRHEQIADENNNQIRNLAVDAAAAALDSRDAPLAVELLEQGKSIIFSGLSQLQAPLEDLRKVEPSLASRFGDLSDEIRKCTLSSSSEPSSAMVGRKSNEDDVSRFQRIKREWDQVLEDIRRLPEFTYFLRPLPFTSLQQAARNGPVIIVNHSKWRTDAIIVLVNKDPTTVPLPTVTRGVIADWVEILEKALSMDSSPAAPKVAAFGGTAVKPGILDSLWTQLVHPIIDVLEALLGVPDLKEKRRIWWCPTSYLWSLPIHAAGIYRPGGRKLPDHYVSSYTPTLTALVRAFETPQSAHPDPKVFLIGQARPPTADPLPFVTAELEAIKATIPNAKAILDEEAVPDLVLEEIGKHSWVHFACHGVRDEKNPFQSKFIVKEDLQLIRIIHKPLPHAELAFLSACYSAAGDVRTPDEVVHLAGAMQFAGFKSVVGTMWRSQDEDAPIIAKAFYEHLYSKSSGGVTYTDSAAALAEAMKVLRTKKVPFDRWINFVHYGA